MYGSFNCITFDAPRYIKAEPLVINETFFYNQAPPMSKFNSSLWGPTCDSIDVIAKDILLPEMNVGDWFYFKQMGAYTIASASTFNGFKKTKVIYTSNSC
jgi:ornithine decarboxylase